MEENPTLKVSCECGFVAQGPEDDVVTAMQDHAINAHNMKATREQILARAAEQAA